MKILNEETSNSLLYIFVYFLEEDRSKMKRGIQTYFFHKRILPMENQI